MLAYFWTAGQESRTREDDARHDFARISAIALIAIEASAHATYIQPITSRHATQLSRRQYAGDNGR